MWEFKIGIFKISLQGTWDPAIFGAARHDEMQLLAKFKKILYMGFRTTLNFQKFEVALNPMYRFLLNFAKS